MTKQAAATTESNRLPAAHHQPLLGCTRSHMTNPDKPTKSKPPGTTILELSLKISNEATSHTSPQANANGQTGNQRRLKKLTSRCRLKNPGSKAVAYVPAKSTASPLRVKDAWKNVLPRNVATIASPNHRDH